MNLRLALLLLLFTNTTKAQQYIRINLLGYTPIGTKAAVFCAKETSNINSFQLIDSATKAVVFTKSADKNFGPYGPFKTTYRLDFSSFNKPGVYYLKAGSATSPFFRINKDVYKGTADFCLQYMRQQRSGFNPFLKDSCHTHDGYTLYGPMKDSTFIDVSGGWHDASDYLQYSTTSANATWHLLMAYRQFKHVFSDQKLANGLDGKNGMPDVFDEAQWGIKWLLKMFPRKDWMFNQLADDRDHQGMRIPKEDTFYGRGFERPVYFISGEPQQRGKFMNKTTGTSSTAAKFTSVFALADYLCKTDPSFKPADPRKSYYDKAFDAYRYALKKPGVTQTASVRSPYIYAEDNWVDDMELASASLHEMVNNTSSAGDNGSYLVTALEYAAKEKITPWLGADTAKHYQWYPFVNAGHFVAASQLKHNSSSSKKSISKMRKELVGKADTLNGYYKEGILSVWNKAKHNAFLRGVPFIWCSNNLTTSFAIQCYWYRSLTGDKSFQQLEQANFDWLFGCNPWGTSMVYGLPSWGDTPVDPHSAFTHLKNYPINGGLVDGPVYTTIFKSLIGIKLKDADEYAEFQSDLAVYHDDYGDYSTNEPTMDGTASLIYLLAAKEAEALSSSANTRTTERGAIIRGDQTKKQISLLFTGDEFAEGADHILSVLKKQDVKASFFLTGRFLNNPMFKQQIRRIVNDGHYIGPHSDQHLLCSPWDNRDSLLVTKDEFRKDLAANLNAIEAFGIKGSAIKYFLPPFEWYNDSISAWTKEMNMQLINYTPGTLSVADYTTPEMKNYRSSEEIYNSILDKDARENLNGFLLLMHIGAGPLRKEKFYARLDEVIRELKKRGYNFVSIDNMVR
jgi:endoglucanase